MKNWNGLFDYGGIDIRVRTGNVVIPPSMGRSWIKTLDEADLQELPTWFCDLILLDQKKTKKAKVDPFKAEKPKRIKKEALKFEPAPISKKTMFFLRTKARNYYFLWDRESPYLKDQSNSCYEYHLCKMGFCYYNPCPYRVLLPIPAFWRVELFARNR